MSEADSSGPRSSAPGGRLAVVVVNYGLHGLIEANLSQVDDPVDAIADVFVVDNFYSAAERAAIAALCQEHDWQLVPRPTNGGFGSGCNAGIEAAAERGATEVLLINPDAVVPGSVVSELHRHVVDEPMDLVSPQVVTSAHTPYFHGIQLDLHSGRMKNRPWPGEAAPPRFYPRSDKGWRDWVGGACMAFSVELWRKADGWDESYFLYWEDVDFSERCVTVGARICVRNDLTVVHDEGAAHGDQRSRARSTVYYYYNCRNRLLYAANHLARGDQLRWLVTTPRESWQILLRGGKRQILTSPRTGWAMICGSVAGIRMLVSGRKKSSHTRTRRNGAVPQQNHSEPQSEGQRRNT